VFFPDFVMALVRRSNLAYCRQFLINYEFYSEMNEKNQGDC